MIAKIILVFLLIFTLNIIVAGSWRKSQAVIIGGHLLCQSDEGSNVDIFLYGKTKIRRLYLLEHTYSDSNGYFESSGRRVVWFGIKFYLKLIHHCLETNVLCRREAIINIPSSFIFKHLKRRRSFGLGTIDLSNLPNQRRICTRAPSRRRRS